MDYVFYQVAAINGFDGLSHYLRAGLILNTCSQYAIEFSSDCSAKFGSGGGGARAASPSSPRPSWKDSRRSNTLLALDALLHGAKLPSATAPLGAGEDGLAAPPRRRARRPPRPPRRRRPRRRPAAPSRTPAPSSDSQPSAGAQQGLLDYLMGGN